MRANAKHGFAAFRVRCLPLRFHACARARQIPECKSQKGHPIFHVEREGFETGPKKKRVLVFGLIHGDEGASGSLARDWLNRLLELERIRNTWRVLPVLNPDGFIAKTRTNARGIDLNRNFPTRDWNETAQAYWKKEAGANPRRFPGSQPGSEPETQCAVRQIDDFKPDLVISIHTPYRIIDMDGPHIQVPPFRALPFRRLGHFPGSLGRYMWRDREVPVVTIELGDGRRPLSSTEEKLLQDIMGDIAIRSGAALGRP